MAQIIFSQCILTSPVATRDGFVMDVTRDVNSGNQARMTLRVLTFWGVRHVAPQPGETKYETARRHSVTTGEHVD
jgi:hypothetical protein